MFEAIYAIMKAIILCYLCVLCPPLGLIAICYAYKDSDAI